MDDGCVSYAAAAIRADGGTAGEGDGGAGGGEKLYL